MHLAHPTPGLMACFLTPREITITAPFHMLERLSHVVRRAQVPGFFLGLLGLLLPRADAQTSAPVVVSTSITFRVMAANLNDNSQTYEAYALRIFQGLKPDVVAIQEFNYLGNSEAEFRAMLNANFGSNFSYYRESGPGYAIPNGIISRWPIVQSGTWEDTDTGVNNRGYAWARIDLPGTTDLYVVSVHLKADNSSASRRAAEAAEIKSLIQANLPTNAWVVVAGDFNIHSSGETALATFKTFLSDLPIPHDGTASADPDTNAGRDERYDYVLPSFTLDTNRVATIIGSRSFPNGLVFDSRLYSPLSDVAPVQQPDSGLAQHMAVVKDFRISYTVTNFVTVPSPTLRLVSSNVFRWSGLSNLTFRVLSSGSPGGFTQVGTATSTGTNYFFTNSVALTNQRFFRVVWP
jgi:endonuclease/exonuclease/phosphatase family metal-dependent hydrolase